MYLSAEQELQVQFEPSVDINPGLAQDDVSGLR